MNVSEGFLLLAVSSAAVVSGGCDNEAKMVRKHISSDETENSSANFTKSATRML